jgi:predicted transcriptional regulator/DNA-binding XRE family transcriptional regulator
MVRSEMAMRSAIGSKIRHARHRLGLTQVETARRLDLSASYLNLIEHDQRPVTAKLLLRFREVLDIDADALSDGQSDVAAELVDALADPVFDADAIDRSEAAATLRASSATAKAMANLYRAYCRQRDRASELGEALRQRETLANINYEFRTLVTTIRSFAEILADNPDIDLDQRRRFLDIIVEDSKRLVPLFGDLLEEGADMAAADIDGHPPTEDVAEFLYANDGYFAELEDAAAVIRAAAGIDAACTYERLAACLERDYGIVGRIVPAAPPRDGAEPEAGRKRLDIPESLSPEARLLAIAKGLAAAACSDAITHRLGTARWATPEARDLARDALTDYVAAAVVMPYDRFLAAARELRHDIERLMRRFCVDFEQVCRRLTTLKRPGAKGIPFHLVRVDMAGNVTWRLGSSGFRIPRYGATCALWNVHSAFLTPGVTRVQLSRMPDGATYISVARAIPAKSPEIVGSPRFQAIELGCDASFARDIVYADGIDMSRRNAAVPVGTTCRLCERSACAQRALPPFRGATTMAAEDAAQTAG